VDLRCSYEPVRKLELENIMGPAYYEILVDVVVSDKGGASMRNMLLAGPRTLTVMTSCIAGFIQVFTVNSQC